MGPSPGEMPPAPQLVVLPTGWGKSIIRDTIAAAKGGVSFSISPLLSLGADQETKLNAEASQIGGPVVSFHLDEYSSHAKIKYIDTAVRSLTLPCNTTIILFTSPQCLLRPIWRNLYLFCISSGLLTQVVVDEAHLFASFGLSFRREFYTLQRHIFNPLAVSQRPMNDSHFDSIPGLNLAKAPATLIETTKCPVIFMTASCSRMIVQQIQLLTGLYISTSNQVFWPGPVDMQRRQLSFLTDYTTQVFSKFKSLALLVLSVNDSSKAILYTNSRWRSETHCQSMRTVLDTGYHGDVVLINGPLNKEEKFFRSRLFTSAPPGSLMLLPAVGEPLPPSVPPKTPNPDQPLPDDDPAFDSFHARVLVATAGATNAGIHDPRIRVVAHDGIPVSAQDLIQPAGRVARYPGANAAHNFFCVFFSLESYHYLVRRIYLPPNSPDHDGMATEDPTELFPVTAYRSMQLQELLTVLTLLTLPQECLHVTLERLSANPYLNHDDTVTLPCGTSCSYCCGHYQTMFRALNRPGVTELFCALLLGSSASSSDLAVPPIREPTLVDALIKGIQDYPGSRQLLFGRDFTSNKKPSPVDVKKVVLLLLAAKIIVPLIYFDDDDVEMKNPIVIARLNYNEQKQPAIMLDCYWRNIRTVA